MESSPLVRRTALIDADYSFLNSPSALKTGSANIFSSPLFAAAEKHLENASSHLHSSKGHNAFAVMHSPTRQNAPESPIRITNLPKNALACTETSFLFSPVTSLGCAMSTSFSLTSPSVKKFAASIHGNVLEEESLFNEEFIAAGPETEVLTVACPVSSTVSPPCKRSKSIKRILFPTKTADEESLPLIKNTQEKENVVNGAAETLRFPTLSRWYHKPFVASVSRRKPCEDRLAARAASPPSPAARISQCPSKRVQSVDNWPFVQDEDDSWAPRLRKAFSTHVNEADFVHRTQQPCFTVAPSALSFVNNVSLETGERLQLPCFKSGSDAIKRIDAHTLAQMIDGQYTKLIDEAIVVDCRFHYEYEGGHITGAVNINSTAAIDKFLFDAAVLSDASRAQRRIALVFHCEFSSYRAPRMALHVRRNDRALNKANYPALFYPEIYILEGGYKSFFQTCNTHCAPQNYVEMEHAQYKKLSVRLLNEFKSAFSEKRRSKSTIAIRSDNKSPSSSMLRDRLHAEDAVPSSDDDSCLFSACDFVAQRKASLSADCSVFS